MKTFKLTVKIVFKIVLALVLFIGTWVFLTPYFRVDHNKDGDQFRNLPEDSIDVLALGSSHMQYAFNPAVYYTKTGSYSYVLGSSCQPFSTSYYLLKEALKTQHPSVVVVDVFTLLPGSQVCYADGMFYKAIDMMEGENRIEAGQKATEGLDPQLQSAYTFDLILNHDHWKDMDFLDLDSMKENAVAAEGYMRTLGHVQSQPVDFMYQHLAIPEVTQKTEVSESEKEWIMRFKELCSEEGIELLFIKTPYQADQEDVNKLAGLSDYLASVGIPFVDYTRKADELSWFMGMDGDTWHNNSWGAWIITDDLAQRTANKVNGHVDNAVLDSLLDSLRKETAWELMNAHNVNPYTMLDAAAQYPCVLLMHYKTVGRPCFQEYETSILQKAGADFDFMGQKQTDYYAVIVDRKVLMDGTEPFETEWNGHSISFTEDAILLDGEEIQQNGELEMVFMGEDLSWSNAIGMDYSKGVFWKNGCESWNCE